MPCTVFSSYLEKVSLSIPRPDNVGSRGLRFGALLSTFGIIWASLGVSLCSLCAPLGLCLATFRRHWVPMSPFLVHFENIWVPLGSLCAICYSLRPHVGPFMLLWGAFLVFFYLFAICLPFVVVTLVSPLSFSLFLSLCFFWSF